MSYILDALKKSDQERQQGSNPTLQTIQRSHKPQNTINVWQVLAVVLMLVVIAILSVYAWIELSGRGTDQKIINSRSNLQSMSAQPQPQVALPKAEAMTPAKAQADRNVVEPREMEVQDTVEIKQSAQDDKIAVEFWELPDTVQQEIPAMTFSFHVYSSNPERRTIIINKRRVKEGAAVSESLRLQEITEKGVVLDWKDNYRFNIDVVENW